ncbi:hypothetical protein TWF694_011911 [Orbilia ellipsospora]|uniref:Uncharacterized protein n=1 Tax=Orbilia ellipsospora TaxID=2528407 RepID=A0AAV9XP86_9PEZI
MGVVGRVEDKSLINTAFFASLLEIRLILPYNLKKIARVERERACFKKVWLDGSDRICQNLDGKPWLYIFLIKICSTTFLFLIYSFRKESFVSDYLSQTSALDIADIIQEGGKKGTGTSSAGLSSFGRGDLSPWNILFMFQVKMPFSIFLLRARVYDTDAGTM